MISTLITTRRAKKAVSENKMEVDERASGICEHACRCNRCKESLTSK